MMTPRDINIIKSLVNVPISTTYRATRILENKIFGTYERRFGKCKATIYINFDKGKSFTILDLRRTRSMMQCRRFVLSMESADVIIDFDTLDGVFAYIALVL